MTNIFDFDAIVLGAGVSGLVAADVLAEENQKTLILDGYGHLGGNHIDVSLGGRSYDIGSFFFQSDSLFSQRFPELLPLYQDIGTYNVQRVTPRGVISLYPFDMRKEVLARGFGEIAKTISSLLWSRWRENPNTDTAAFTRYWLGRYFSETSGLMAYLRRFYGTDPQLIEGEFARKRMAWIPANAQIIPMFRRVVLKKKKIYKGRHMVRPKEGFARLYDHLRQVLVQRGVAFELGQAPCAIRRLPKGGFVIDLPSRQITARQIVSTIPLNQTLALCGLPGRANLRTANLTSLFYSFQGQRGFDASVLYNFSTEGAWKRLTVHSDFYGETEGRLHFSLEAISADQPYDPAEVDRDFRAHLAKVSGFLAGDLRLEGASSISEAYPVYLEGATRAAQAAHQALKDFGILSFGRQGGFDYQPSAGVATHIAQKMMARAA